MNTKRSRKVTPQGAAVLEHLARERRRSLTLPEDEQWLRDITAHPSQLLKRMTDASVLYRIGKGRYVVGPPGTSMPRQSVRAEALVDARLRGRADYYIGFFSAFIAHELTDLHSREMTVGVRQEDAHVSRLQAADVEIITVRLSRDLWPTPEDLEQVRTERGSMEQFWRSTLERTLVDGLLRPDRSGGIETVMLGWSRAARGGTDWGRVAEIAGRLGPTVARRASFVLDRVGEAEAAERAMEGLEGRSSTVLLDRAQEYGEAIEPERDARTGVMINLPAGYLDGWLNAEPG